MSAIVSAIQPGIRSIIGSALTLPNVDLTPEQVVMAIFAGGAKGAWYERSRPATRYQESIGITLASAAGGPVGLGLSLDQGGGRGLELAANGLAAWTPGTTSTVSAVGDRVRVTLANSTNSRAGQAIGGLTVGRAYEVIYSTYKGTNSGNTIARIASTLTSTVPIPAELSSAADVVGGRLQFVAAFVTQWAVFIGLTSTVGQYFDVGPLSVRELPGNHQLQATAGLRPLFQTGPQRLVFDGVDDVLTTTFPEALGAACTVIRAIPGTGVVITTGQNIGTSFADGVSAAALIIVDRALSSAEIAAVTSYGNQQLAL